MSASDKHDLGRLPSADFGHLQDLADRHEHAWENADGSAEFDNLLPPPGDPLRPAALVELIKTDLEMRWRKRRPRDLEWYAERFPELGPAASLPADLIAEEYRVRQRHGDRPPLEAYQTRFPDQFAALNTMLTGSPTVQPGVAVTGASVRPTRVAAAGEPAPARGVATDPTIERVTASPEALICGYRPMKMLGQGGFGKVYLAEAPGGVLVALKVIEAPLEHRSTQSERQALDLIKNLTHLHLLPVHAFFSQPSRLVIAMERADGSLKDRLEQHKDKGRDGVPADELLRHLRESADALDFLHERGVWHRDIKPENILLVNNRVKLADFGLARVVEENRHLVSMTGAGTPAYMPKEVWEGRTHKHSDQYALALTYAEMRLGRRMITARNQAAAMLEHMDESPDLDGMGSAEQAAVLRALAKDPDARFSSCTEFAEAVAVALGFPASQTVAPPAQTGRRDASRPQAPGVYTAGSPLTRRLAQPDRWRVARTAAAVAAVGTLVSFVVLAGATLFGFIGHYHTSATATHSAADTTHAATQTTAVASPPVVPPVTAAPTRELLLPRVGQGWSVRPVGGEILDDGERYPAAVVLDGPASMSMEFHYVRSKPGGSEAVPPFYIAANKVTHGQFQVFFTLDPGLVKHDTWKLNWAENKVIDPLFPVLRVTPTEAWQFCRWVGGDLPTWEQWRKAAGLYQAGDPPAGPFGEQYEASQVSVGRGRLGPTRAGAAGHSSQPYALRDMFGNGKEWTRTVLRSGDLISNVFVGRQGFGPGDYVVQVGKSYAAREPLSYAELAAPPEADKFDNPDPHCGFRVVLEHFR